MKFVIATLLMVLLAAAACDGIREQFDEADAPAVENTTEAQMEAIRIALKRNLYKPNNAFKITSNGEDVAVDVPLKDRTINFVVNTRTLSVLAGNIHPELVEKIYNRFREEGLVN